MILRFTFPFRFVFAIGFQILNLVGAPDHHYGGPMAKETTRKTLTSMRTPSA